MGHRGVAARLDTAVPAPVDMVLARSTVLGLNTEDRVMTASISVSTTATAMHHTVGIGATGFR